jgi:hypothetical protein
MCLRLLSLSCPYVRAVSSHLDALPAALVQSDLPSGMHSSQSADSRGCCLRRLHVESVVVRTATGPGGISGPLRVDLEGRYSYDVMGVRSSAPSKPCGVHCV